LSRKIAKRYKIYGRTQYVNKDSPPIKILRVGSISSFCVK
jgi:hypothetical protein